MKVGFFMLALTVLILASAAPIPLVSAQQSSQQERGLSPEDRRKLSRSGPEDFFSGVKEGDARKGGNAANSKKGGPRPSPTPSGTSTRQAATGAAQPSTPQPQPPSAQQSPVPTPSATVAAAAGIEAGSPPSPLSQDNGPGKIDSKWAAPILIA